MLLLTLVLGGLVRMVAKALFATPPQQVVTGELGWLTTLPMVILLVMMLVMGTHIPQPVSRLLANASTIVLSGNDQPSTQFSWLWASFETTAAPVTSPRVQGGVKVSYLASVSLQQPRGTACLAALKQQFPGAVLDEERQTFEQVTITVKLNLLPDIVHYLYYQHDGWLPVLFGNDERTLNGHYAVYYALSMEGAEKCWIVVKALVDAQTREFPSVTPRVPAAVWGEREIRDMYGLIPVGLPDQRRLVLPDDWPDDLHPLRKDTMDYRLRPEPTSETENYSFVNDGGSSARIVPIGPLHITSDEPGHFRLFVDGERIVDADYRLFYVHRGMEKLAETRMGYNEVTFLSDRVCGICGFAHSVAYTTSVENALGIVVPQRAHTIRSVLLEVERLHSHLLNIGLSSHFVGFDTGFMQFFRIREKSMTMAELLTGSRKTYGLNLIGGIRRDILKEQRVKTIQLVKEMRAEVAQLVDMLLSTPNMAQRTQALACLIASRAGLQPGRPADPR